MGYDALEKEEPKAKAKASKPKAKAKAKTVPCKKAKAKALEKGSKREWVKLRKTRARNPERSYITGTLEKGGKMRLIVEVSRARSEQYDYIIDQLMDSLAKENLGKDEALELRDALCKVHQ